MRILFNSFFIGMVLLTSPASSAAQPVTATQLIQQAENEGLASHSQWLALLHYKEEVWTFSVVSQADDPRFFLAEDGDTDSRAELQADIRAFLQPSGEGHAQCLFPARWFWIKQQLGLDAQFDVSCPRFEKWQQSMAADSLTLVFPSMYLNNPGSSFGHTFLRFDNSQSELLSNALNYAASYRFTDNMVKYVYNGLFGGYNGIFNIRSYFEMVEEYSNLENRDIWEYRLDYSPEEIQQLIRHVWEVMQIDFDYYFFSENCSYRLLALLDVVRADSHLSAREHFPYYAIPVDTVRVVDEAGLISGHVYRPSLVSKIKQKFGSVTEDMQSSIVALADDQISPDKLTDYTSLQRAQILDAAYEVLQMRDRHKTILAEQILQARSQVQVETMPVDHAQVPPETGHASARFSIAAGRVENRNQLSIELRPAFHDLLDAPTGYVQGAGISILQTRLRVLQGDSPELDALVFISMDSLSPLTKWRTPVSWSFETGLRRKTAAEFKQSDDFLSFDTRVAAGFSLGSRTAATDTLYFLQAVLDVNVADALVEGYSSGAGIKVGLFHYNPAGQFEFLLESMRDVAGNDSERDTVKCGYQFDVGQNLGLRLRVEKNDYQVTDELRWLLGLGVYF